jgi:hypothetical protein
VIDDQDQHSPNHSNNKAIKVYARDAVCSEHAEHPVPDYRANDSQHDIQEYPSPVLFTSLLPVNPAINPNTIQAKIDIIRSP